MKELNFALEQWAIAEGLEWKHTIYEFIALRLTTSLDYIDQ